MPPSIPELASRLGSLAHLPSANFHALLIGIGDYKNGVSTLDGTVRDMNNMKEFLTGAFAISDGASLDIRTLVDTEASSKGIVEAIQKLTTDPIIKHGDIIVIYYAGHGATMPPPEGWPGWTAEQATTKWPEWAELQCLVAQDARVRALPSPSRQGYCVEGAVLDLKLASLLRDLADKKGNNITVILDSCHSGSSTRGLTNPTSKRGVEFQDPNGNRVTVHKDHERPDWHRSFGRGPHLSHELRYSGLGSHVLLAACSSKETAADDCSFTQVLLKALRSNSLDTLSYSTLIDKLDDMSTSDHQQHPLCEGDAKTNALFDVAKPRIGRLKYQVVKRDKSLILTAGEMLCITEEAKFDVYVSTSSSLLQQLVGTFTVSALGPTTCALKTPESAISSESLSDASVLVAFPVTLIPKVIGIHVPQESLRKLAESVLEGESAEDRMGRPQVSIVDKLPDANDNQARQDKSVHLTMTTTESGDTSTLAFEYPSSSEIYQKGLTSTCNEIPRDPPTLLRLLRAATHFFMYLGHAPTKGNGVLGSKVEVRIHELRFDDWIATQTGPAERFVSERLVHSGRGSDAIHLRAAAADLQAPKAPLYGIELVNDQPVFDLFVWVFFFDCSTFQILPLYDPRKAKGGSTVDPSVPHRPIELKSDEQTPATALNFRDGGGKILELSLRPGQVSDVGYLKIFMSTKFRGAGLESITQGSVSSSLDEKKDTDDDRGIDRGVGRISEPRDPLAVADGDNSRFPDLWDSWTIPVVQTSELSQGSSS